MYGDQAVVVGKDDCADFRARVPREKRQLGVAGMFNTGTNLLDTQLQRNVKLPRPSLWQVPWGKHRMAAVRGNHTAPDMEAIDIGHVLPVVMIRDPYSWLQSMCAHPYAATWPYGPHHCPNLVPNAEDRRRYRHVKDAFAVTVNFDKNNKNHFESLVHLWSEWYAQYLNVDYPILMSKKDHGCRCYSV